jgi:hypothetical protein
VALYHVRAQKWPLSMRCTLAADWAGAGEGLAGQDVANPLWAEIRNHVALRHRLLQSLGVEESAAPDASATGRALARQRWSA